MRNFKTGFFIAICFVQVNYAQINQKSEIIISEDNLISLINTIKQKRDSLFLIRQSRSQVVYNHRINDNTGNETIGVSDKENFKDLEARMKLLDSKLDFISSLLQKQNLEQATIIQKNTAVDPVENKTIKSSGKNTDDAYLREKIASLEQEIFQLRKAHLNEKKSVPITNKTTEKIIVQKETVTPKLNPVVPTAITNNYYTQPKEEAVQKSIRDTLVIEKREISDYDELVKKYSESSQNILFDNNSALVKETYFDSLDQLVALCHDNTKIDLFLKGFASQKGNVLYNQKLSMLRTESVKKYLIEKGVHPSRILSQYHGVDYASTSEENARRVTITYIIRR
ncbi:OmpA family protein [Flavobacterium sp. NG2]|uniref:OmpA family protein n=1 Tax=Flavobacterium sp. NG2 TaxID=3097547 RepID=UPI002A83DDD4|nr:OmpA family protein [Flavobacterium sp. NG2]WPR71480.1 OmpA family protein [Flavobacterium sp. NG2]